MLPCSNPIFFPCRSAFAETYALTAGKVAEQIAKLRAVELAARDDFRAAVERYVPSSVLR